MINYIIDNICFNVLDSENVMKNNIEYIRLNSKFDAVIESLKKNMTEEQKKKMNELEDLQCDMESECALQYFKEGFKRGVSLVCGCIDGI